jgi:hypothetical protein
MTTVVDPSGTPVPVFNRSGVTIVSVSATGTTQGAAAAISAASGQTIALVTISENNTAVKLPSTADIGDLVEVYAFGGTVKVFPSSGETLNGNSNAQDVQDVYGRLFRKVSATAWKPLGSA